MSGKTVMLRNAATLTESDIDALVSGKSSVNEIARKYDEKHATIKRWLSVRGIDVYPLKKGNPKALRAAIPRWKRVIAMRKKKGLTKTAQAFGISPQRVDQICKQYE